MYRIEFDEKTGILTIRRSGFQDMEESGRMIEDIVKAMESARRKAGRLRLLSIAEDEGHVYPQKTIDAFRKLVEQFFTQPEDKAAYIVRSTLARMQIARMDDTGRLKAFATIPEATEWLLD